MANNKHQNLQGYLLLTDQIRQLEEANEELKKHSALKDRLLSIVSHDTRAPLSSLKSLLNLLAAGDLTQAEHQEMTAHLKNQVEQLGWFLENLLFWTRTNFSQISPIADRVPLHLLVNETLRLLSFSARRKRVNISIHVSEQTVIYADGEMVKMILRNLISNAIKFCRANDHVVIEASTKKGVVKVSVKDTGPGMAEGTLAAVFDLSHLSTKGSRDEIGVGLGLSLCKEFVEMMGGNIQATSKEGEGSCFEFTVPQYREVSVATGTSGSLRT